MHRDDDEAARAHIESLERELADTRRERDEARARAEHAQHAQHAQHAKAGKAKGPPRGKGKKPRKGKDPSLEIDGAPSWRRQHFLGGVGAAAALAYSAVAVVLAADASEQAMTTVCLGGSVWMLASTALIAWRTGAPGIFNGAISTLLWSSGSMGAVFAASTPYLAESMGLEGALGWGLRGVLTLAAVSIGSIATAHFTTDAASSDTVGSD